MKTKKAKILNDALVFWMTQCVDILDATEYSKEYEGIEELKKKYSEMSFETMYNDFMQELVDNIVEYQNIEYIDKYLEGNLTAVEDHRDYDGFDEDMPGEIIKNNFEVKFLVQVAKSTLKYRTKLNDIYYSENDTNYSDELRKIFIREMKKIDPDFDPLSIDSEEEESDLKETVKQFHFDLFKTEIEAVKTVKDKRLLIKNRMIDFEQWFIQNTPDLAKYLFKETKYANAQFYRMCETELKRCAVLSEVNDTVKIQQVMVEKPMPYKWTASDTDLLELVAALYKNESIQRKDGKPLNRKELLGFFEELFGLEIKDAEAKLTRATARKTNMTPFMDKLKLAFENYAEEKDEKLRKRK